jgi:PAS domain S-box-containing protein
MSDTRKTKAQLMAELANLRRQLSELALGPNQAGPTSAASLDGEVGLGPNFVSAVLDTAAALVMVVDLSGRILRFNRACEATTGYSFAEVQGQVAWELFVANEERPQIEQIFAELFAGGHPEPYQSYWLTKDRRRRLIAWTSTALLDQADQVEYVVNTGTDITEQHQLEERLVAIHRLGRELNLLRDEASIWEIALQTAAFVLEFKSAGYGVVDDDPDRLDYLYQPVRGVPTTIRLQLPSATPERVGLLKSYSQPYSGLTGTPDATGPAGHSWLTSAMRVADRLLGVIDIESRGPHPFRANDQQLLQTLADQTAVAIENARLHQEARQRVDELTTMNMVGQAITSTLNLEDTLTIITDHSIRLLEATAASVVLNDEVEGNIWFNAASGGSSDFVRGKRLAPGQGIVGWVIENGDSVLVADVSQDPRFFKSFDEQTGFTTESIICAPLRTGDQTIGAIEVINKKVGSFTPEDLQLLSWLATPAATAIENARLFEAERTARTQAELLRGATSTLAATLDPDYVLNSILVHLEGVVSFDKAYVFFRQQDFLQVVTERGQSRAPARSRQRRYPIDNALYREIQATGRPVILVDTSADPRFAVWGEAATIRSWMGVPLIARGEVIGCLTLESGKTGAYGQVQADLAQAFANQAAAAIQNARLFEQVRLGRKRLQSLSRRLVEVQETERRHIARELHDEAGQSLSSLIVQLGLLERKVEDAPAILSGLGELKEMTNQISENLHRLAINLRPASLDHLGLETTLRQHIENFGRQNNLITQFEAVGLKDKRLPPDVETNLYRVVQEALTNVVRHARASQVDVLLERRGDQVVAIIEDNGVGFDAETVGQSNRLGLLGMRERAEMLNGNLMIESASGIGTTIYVEVPYDHSDTNR